jgi:hypothetical protein
LFQKFSALKESLERFLTKRKERMYSQEYQIRTQGLPNFDLSYSPTTSGRSAEDFRRIMAELKTPKGLENRREFNGKLILHIPNGSESAHCLFLNRQMTAADFYVALKFSPFYNLNYFKDYNNQSEI